MPLFQSFSLKFLVLPLVLLLFIGAFWFFAHKTQAPSSPQSCTLEAKICPDGSAVGRTGPNCDFSPCPSAPVEPQPGWEKITDKTTGLSFWYPKTFSTNYIHPFDWPPLFRLQEESFSCNAAGEETSSGGKSEKRLVNGHEYCVTTETEGAAGSIYSQYAYAFPWEGKTAIFTFSVRSVQCGNYTQKEMQACDAERKTFDLDALIDEIAQTLSPR